jgi:hypothetical protein
MILVFLAPVFVRAANSALTLEARGGLLCIVDTKLPQVRLYDPLAGPFATGMYVELARRRLNDGSKLNMIVFPASSESAILPEVHRLNCTWVLQLRYQQQVDDDVFGQTYPRRTRFDTLLYSLWNASTRDVIKSGSGIVNLGDPLVTPYATFGKQIVKALNHQR